MKSIPDVERFARYQSIIRALLARDSFQKQDIYEVFGGEQKPFIGKVIGELFRDGYLTKNGLKSKPVYSWSDLGQTRGKPSIPATGSTSAFLRRRSRGPLQMNVPGNVSSAWALHNSGLPSFWPSLSAQASMASRPFKQAKNWQPFLAITSRASL